jgi:hypothetical protein
VDDNDVRAASERGLASGRRAWAALIAVLVVLAAALVVLAERGVDEGGIGGRAVPPRTTQGAP